MNQDFPNIAALRNHQNGSNGNAKPSVPSVPPADAADLVTRASDIESRTVKWAWKGRLALGYVTLWTGEEGLGKSMFAAWLASRITRGELVESLWHGSPENVLVVAGEDGFHDTWRPRLEVAGADLDRVGFLPLDRLPANWNVRDGIHELHQALKGFSARLIVFDALLDHMPDSHGGENINSATFVRGAMRPLRELVRDLNIAGIVSMHPPKARGGGFRDLVQGSQAFTAIFRLGLYFDWHPDDAEDDPNRRRVLVKGKQNIGRDPGALEFRVTGKELRHGNGEVQERGTVVDVRPSDVTLAALLRVSRTAQGEGEPSKKEQAAEIIREQLSDAEWHPSRPIREDILRPRGLDHDQTVGAAKQIVGVETRQRTGSPHGGWEWRARNHQHPPNYPPLILTPETAPNPSNDGQIHRINDLERDGADPAGNSLGTDPPEPGRCAKHPAAGRWRWPASSVWICTTCHPAPEDSSGMVIEPSSAQTFARGVKRT